MKSSSSNEALAQLSRELFEEAFESFDDGQPLYGIDYLKDHTLSWIWGPAERVGSDFVERRELFLWLLDRLLCEGRIKLHKNGVFLQSSIKEQVEAFRSAWPSSEKPYPSQPDADFYLWFFDPACPAGVAWRQPDGSYQIAD